MHKLFKIPLAFLFIAGCMGLFLRYQTIAPVHGVTYSYFLHGHSHVMFLGWVFNMLYLAFVAEFTDRSGKYILVFWILQILVLGMLVSFPMQGYGAVSIVLSTLHTAVAIYFIIIFFKSAQANFSLPATLAKLSTLFFILSSIGPFFLGYLKAHDLDQSNLYRFTVYFYLHFQYNGFFFFGIMSLFVKMIEPLMSPEYLSELRKGCYVLAVACIPTYFLSVLWAEPGIIFNGVGFVAALAQMIGLLFFIQPVKKTISTFESHVKILLLTVFSALILKFILQLLSSLPGPALMANEYRSIVIAYLHLVLIGVISLFLIAWLICTRRLQITSWALYLFVIAFITSELSLIALPWSNQLAGLSPQSISKFIFFLSALMVLSTASFLKADFHIEKQR